MIDSSQKKYEILKKVILYQGKFSYVQYQFRHHKFDGTWSTNLKYELLERPPAAAVLPYDPLLDVVVLIEQFRLGTIYQLATPWVLEVVAGVKDANESEENVAIRETKEEANLEILDLHLLYDYFVSPGASNEYIHLYIGRVNATNADGIYGLQDENEDIRVHSMSFKEAIEKLQQGHFKNAPIIISLQWLNLNRDWLKELWQRK